jgi:hypothetical protein
MRRQMVEEPPNPRVVAGLPGPEKQKKGKIWTLAVSKKAKFSN